MARTYVRLSDVPMYLRVAAAWQLIRDEHLHGLEAMRLRLLAIHPRQNPGLDVDADTVRAVCGARRSRENGVLR